MDLSHATDELLAAPWESFVETRTRLADELAGAGKREDSRALKKIRRPTAAAWATNQVVRRSRAAVDAYLAASDDLRGRQAALLGGGDRSAYQAAAEAFRQATASLTQAVRQVLQHGGRPPDRAQIEGVMANVRAAALAGERRADLLAGRLLADLPSGQGGLEGVFGADLVAHAASTAPRTTVFAGKPHAAANDAGTADRPYDPRHQPDAQREADARAAREERARRVAAAMEEEAAAITAAAAASAEAERARAARGDAEQWLKEAEAAVTKARATLHDAKAIVQAAERAARDRQAAADRARARRESLETPSGR